MESFRRISTASTNTNVISNAASLRGYYITNAHETQFRYVHLYDMGFTPTNASRIKWTIALPNASGSNVSWEIGLLFETAIAFAFSTSPTSLVAVASNEIVANFFWIDR